MKMERFVTFVCGILSLLILCAGLYCWQWYKAMNRVVGYQPNRIMVDGSLYMNFGDTQPEKPKGEPDGTITEIIGTAYFPKEDGQANFGAVGMPYWLLEDEVVVEYGKYYLFDQS